MVGIFFTARLGSTRLPQKHLIEVSGRSFIEWLIERYAVEFRDEIEKGEVKLFITTSIRPENKEFERIFNGKNVNVFYGSDENIPLRHLECALANEIEYIISIDGDDILCSAKAARTLLKELKNDHAMVQTSGLPLGMNVTGYKTDFLQKSLSNIQTDKLETGWGRIFDKDSIYHITIPENENGKKLRMTLDYQEDALFFEKIISDTGDDILGMNDDTLIELILKNNWSELNAGLHEIYWANFNKQRQDED